jgi:hypothetical protein
MRVPWEQRETAVSSGFDPASLTERAARRRVGDAGLGREVAVPVYFLRPPRSTVSEPPQIGVLVRLSAGRAAADLNRVMLPADFPSASRIWDAARHASGHTGAVRTREGWVRVGLGSARASELPVALVLRSSDWALLQAALAVRARTDPGPQDAPVERVAARFLGRLDGLDGTASAGLWGRLALEVVQVRHPERLADSVGLRWRASWGLGGFAAASGGRADGIAGSQMVLDLGQQRIDVDGRVFRVRTLPDWEREQAARDLGMPPLKVLAWPVVPLSEVIAFFDGITPAPLTPLTPPVSERPQDATHRPRDRRDPQDRRGPQDAR